MMPPLARVLCLSDMHLTASEAGRVRGVATRPGLLAALVHARRAGPFDQVVLAGDLAEDPRVETYRALRELVADLPGPLVLAGNHDRREPLAAAFAPRPEAFPGCIGFVEAVGSWRLVGVDSHLRGRVKGRLGDGQLAWLAGVLAADERPVVLFVHHPPVDVGTRWLDVTRLADAAALAALLARSGRVKLVVHGHVHMPSDTTLAGARVVGMPSTAFQFVPGSFLPRRGPATSGYRVLELGADTYKTEVIYVP